MKNRKIIFSLIYQGQKLYNIDSSDIDCNITIGRSSDCVWKIPASDKLASGHHALIKKSGRGIILSDTDSRNGIFLKGEKIAEIKLSPGMRISIGNAELIVEKQEISSSNIQNSEFHKLEFMSGARKGETVPIDQKEFSIGSSPENHLVIQEHLISKVHTQLRLDDSGACWIKDNNSTNGTSVNRTLLAHGKERMLQDGDVISIAFVDLRFLDSNTKHTRSYIGLKIFAAVATVFLLVGGYLAYLAAAPNSYDLIQEARGYAAKTEFSRAKQILQSASTARDYSRYKAERDMLLEQISIWELTRSEWQSVCSSLNKRKWVEAVRTLSSIRYDRMESWNWNEYDAVHYKNLALRVKNNVDLYLKVSEKLGNQEATNQELKILERELSAALGAEKAQKKEKMLSALLSEMEILQKQLLRNLTLYKQLDTVLGKLNLRVPNFNTVVKELEDIEKNGHGAVKISASRFLAPIRKLHNSQNILLNNAASLTCLDFKKVNFNLDLPTIDECAVSPYINSQRNTILRIHSNFLSAHKQVLYMHNLLKKGNISLDESHPLLLHFADENVMKKVVECDTLARKLPVRSRKTPQGVYDQMLGIEYFYEFLRTIPAQYDDSILERIGFTPECVFLRRQCEQYSNFVRFAKLPENRWLLRNNILKLHNYCASQLKLVDSLIAEWKKESEAKPLSRQSIILRGLIIYLSPYEIDKAYAEKVAADFKKFREPVALLNNLYDNASPEKAIEIRNKILHLGLPGDPIVRRMWATKQ